MANSLPSYSRDNGDGEKSTCSNGNQLPRGCNESLESTLKIAGGGFPGNGSKVQELD